MISSSKFIQTLKTLSEDELTAYEIWLKSPYCNTNKNLIHLFVKVKKYKPDFKNQKLTKERLFKQILPKGKFSHRRMNNLLSEAYLSLERFLIFNHLSGHQSLQKDILSQEFQNRHLESWFFKTSTQEIDRITDKTPKDWEDHLDLFRLHRRIYQHPNASTRMKPGQSSIVHMGEQIDLVYLLEKAAIINEKIFRQRILKNENHDINKDLKLWQATSEHIQHPSIAFYKMRFSYTEENMLKQYLKLKQAFFSDFETLNKKEQKIHLLSLLNDTFFLIKATLLDITEVLPLYQLGLKTGIIFTNGKLLYNTYAIIVAASNTKQTFKYTLEFIDNYTQYLEPKFQPDASHWARAHTYYWKKELHLCLDILVAYNFTTNYFQRFSKVLTCQVYFDLSLQDDSYQFYLFNYFDAFEKWLLREKTRARINIKPYLRFVQVSRTLAKSYSSVNFKAEAIQHLLETETNIQAANWLSQKIMEIIALKK